MSNINVQHRKPTQAESLMAGVVAGAVEGFATYPAEFVKTKAQFSSSSSTKVGVFPLSRGEQTWKLTEIVPRCRGNRERHDQESRCDWTVLRVRRAGSRKWTQGWCAIHVVRHNKGDATGRTCECCTPIDGRLHVPKLSELGPPHHRAHYARRTRGRSHRGNDSGHPIRDYQVSLHSTDM